MDLLTLFGVIVIALMVLFYALEKRSHFYTLAFSIACAFAALYGFLAGAWPFSIAELIWSGIAYHRWMSVRSSN